MPLDQYTKSYGDLCLNCHTEERVFNHAWCQTCYDAGKRRREEILAAQAAELQAYVPSHQRPPSTAAPIRECPRCGSGHSVWVTTPEGRLQCGQCDWTP
jgi:hypothetical protein